MLNNNFLKLLSVLIALFLWVTVVVVQVETKTINVPVILVHTPSDNIATTPITNVSVTIRGSAKLLTNMNYSSIMLNMDVRSLPVGDTVRRILPSDFTVPFGIEITEVDPPELKITIDQIETKYLPIAPTFIGEVENGYKIDSISTSPDFAYIKGAKSKIINKSFIPTSPINISDIQTNTVFHIGFKNEDGVTSISPDEVEVRVKVTENISSKVIENVPVSCINLMGNLKLKNEISLESVTVRGRVDVLDNFLTMTTFFVDCSNVTKAGKYTKKIGYKTTIENIEISNYPKKIVFEIE